MDNSISHDFLLLIVNLMQLKNRERILKVFIESANHLVPDAKIRLLNDSEGEGGDDTCIPLSTSKSTFSILSVSGACPDEFIDILHNACSMVALILEKLEQEETLARKNEEKLQGEEKKYKDLFDKMMDGSALHEMIFDKKGRPKDYRFLEVNPAFEKMTGLSAKKVVGKTLLEIFPDTEKFFIETYGDVVRNRKAIKFEKYTEYLNKYFEVLAYPTENNKFATIFFDITQRKNTENKLAESQHLLEVTQEIGHMGSWKYDLDKNEGVWSDESYSIFNVPKGTKVTYESFLECIHPDDRKYVATEWEKALEGGPFDIEFRLLVDGELKWVREKAELEFDNTNNTRLAVGFIQDITERKLSEEEWQKTFDVIGDMVAVIGEDMTIVRANKAMYDYFNGISIIGEKCFKLFHQTDSPPDECKACMALKNNESANFEITQKHDDEIKYFSISVFPFGSRKGKKQFIHVLRDVTEQRKYEEEKRQGEKLQSLGELAGGLAHDLNNNLTAIMGFNSLLELNIKDETLKRYIKTIQTATQRSAELTSKMLAFARKGKYENLPVDIHQVLNNVISLLERSIDKKILIIREFEASIPVTLGDNGQLTNAFLNICINARDAMEGQNGVFKISTSIASIETVHKLKKDYSLKEGKYLEISFSDTGKGMDDETIKQIFEPFFTTKGRAHGTGLGLAATYGTVLNHGGVITVDSAVNQGTTLTIYLPLHTDKKTVGKENGEPCLETGEGNVMIVDDEEYILHLASEMLEELGYSPYPFRGGWKAIDFYKENWKKIDLVILDLIMPDLNGKETFEELKNINPDVKVLLSSGHSKKNTIDKLIEAGVKGSLAKPYHLKAFAQKLKDALGN